MNARIDADFRLQPQDFSFIGRDLSRPECVIACSDGVLWASDNRATAMRIDPDGTQTLFGPRLGTPNGLALDRGGVLYVADIDGERVYRVFPDATHELVTDRLTGAVNFVYLDAEDRLWVTVSTRTKPRSKAAYEPMKDGYVARRCANGFVTVADGFCFTNEIRIDREARNVYVAETMMGRVMRCPLAVDGTLGPAEVFGPESLFAGAKVDGICFDEAGGLWVTEVTRNAIYRISPSGAAHCVFDDPERRVLDFPTSLAFGGDDRRTVFVGSLHMKALASFRAPWPGAPMRHWIE